MGNRNMRLHVPGRPSDVYVLGVQPSARQPHMLMDQRAFRQRFGHDDVERELVRAPLVYCLREHAALRRLADGLCEWIDRLQGVLFHFRRMPKWRHGVLPKRIGLPAGAYPDLAHVLAAESDVLHRQWRVDRMRYSEQ